MLDVIAQLESLGMETAFGAESQHSTLADLSRQAAQGRVSAMTCIIMTPDGGETEPQGDQPDQDDEGKRDQDEQDSPHI
ncbi:hypothetical protein ACF3M1_07090 [Luteimonas sp. WGS1318]|uniref:hypothetical protein n=1 Tax=Luteimonas sp. WGS1318 TaxID=3366815 RepID=UPI00372D1F86